MIEVICDHRNLILFRSKQVLKPQHARWAFLLSSYQFTITYRSGSLNAAADALSRRADLAPQGGDGSEPGDPKPHTVLPERFWINAVEATTDRKVITDEVEMLAILRMRHDSHLAGHPGQHRTFELVARDFYWKGMRKYIIDYVEACDTCHRNKMPRHKPFGLLQPLPVPERPWSSISMDFITKLPISDGYDSVFVVVCRMTKQAHFIPCRETMKAEEFASLFIDNIFRIHGMPDDIVSDRGSLFRSDFWQQLLKKMKVVSKMSTAFHPQTDGQTERVNQTLEQYLRC